MHTLPGWAWWIIALVVLLSPIFAFLMAIAVEILIGVLKETGIPALLVLVAAAGIASIRFRRLRSRPRADAPS